jgi:RNA recognition motif-containing protein
VVSLDLANLSAEAIKQSVSDQCAKYGRVEQIQLHCDPGNSHNFAIVSMSHPDEAKSVVREIGDAMFGFAALIKIAQSDG